MSAVVDKVIRSGLVDKAVIEMLEKVGALPEGSSDKVKEDALKGATTDALHKLADEMSVLMERESKIRETFLDLKNLKWPVTFSIKKNVNDVPFVQLTGLRDQAGRYFIEFRGPKKEWLTPGYIIEIFTFSGGNEAPVHTLEEITESQILYEGKIPVCYQISVNSDRFISQ